MSVPRLFKFSLVLYTCVLSWLRVSYIFQSRLYSGCKVSVSTFSYPLSACLLARSFRALIRLTMEFFLSWWYRFHTAFPWFWPTVGWSYSIHYMFVVIYLFFLIILAVISRLISGDAIPLMLCTSSIVVGFKHPVINIIVSFNDISTFFVWYDSRLNIP